MIQRVSTSLRTRWYENEGLNIAHVTGQVVPRLETLLQGKQLSSQVSTAIPSKHYFGYQENVKILCHEGRVKEVPHMVDQGSQKCRHTFVNLLQECVRLKALPEGQQVHMEIIRIGLKPTVFLWNTLINTYINCGLIVDAHNVFDKMPEKNVFTWTLMIAGCSKNRQDEEALKLFQDMKGDCVKPDMVMYVSILKVCSNLANLEEGKQIHADITKDGFPSDVILGTALVDMYARSRSLHDARRVFDQMPQRDLVSWDVMIAAYSQHGFGDVSFKLFLQMQLEGVNPDMAIFGNILEACAYAHFLDIGKRIHAIIRNEFWLDVFMGTALVDMYAKCGSLEEARNVFHEMPKDDVASWDVMIAAYADHAEAKEAFRVFSQMQQHSIMPNKYTYVGILKACAKLIALEQGKRMHACIMKTEFEVDNFLCNALIDMYAKCRSLDGACVVFKEMAQPDTVSWNVIISEHVNHGNAEEALGVFWQMAKGGMIPDEVTFLSVLRACATLRSLEHGRLIHAKILGANCESYVNVASTLIDMYAKCGSVQEAQKVFDSTCRRDVVSWNTMISAYVEENDEDAFKLFLLMVKDGLQPDKVTSLIILNVCAKHGAVEDGRKIHRWILESGLDSDVMLGNALVDMYAKCGSMHDAHRAFSSIPARNVVSWTSLISGYVLEGHGDQAFKLFQTMEQEGIKPDEVTLMCMLKACADLEALEKGELIHHNVIGNGFESNAFVSSTLVDMYFKCGSIEKARQVFNQMPKHNVVLWTTMIAGYSEHGYYEEALKAFLQMQHEGVRPDKVTFIGALNACAGAGVLELGKQIHAYMFESEPPSVSGSVGNTLICMYAKCGSIEDACQVFSRMPDLDVVSWTVLVEGHAHHGNGEEALRLVAQMQQEGMKVSLITLIGVLSACSHAGLVAEGCAFFDCMNQGHAIEPTPEHYACMVDLLGRAGYLEEAEEFIKQMLVKPNAVVWKALLGACRIHGDLEMAERASEQIFELEPRDVSALVTLSNVYAAAGRWIDPNR